jgi:hypothetical protein
MQVSILTITQLSRHESFKLLIEYVLNQTYKNIVEWIIIDGSKNINDSNTNINLIKNLNIPFPQILYKDNITNNINKKEIINDLQYNLKGDIIICMDDDDFYSPSFIEYIISKMINTTKNIVTTQLLYIHDIIINKTFKLNYNIEPFIYRKGFNINDEIEYIFTEYSLIKFIHNENNYFDKILTISTNDKIYKLEDEIIEYLIPDKFYKKYQEIFINNNNTFYDYDIIYFIGEFSIVWDPTDKNLAGSEQAIINLSENWVKEGKKVIVYGNFNNLININGVDYDNWTKFPFNKKINTLILWRKSSILSIINHNFEAKKTIIDLHDNMFVFNDLNKEILINFFNKIDNIHLKSEYHKNSFINYFGNNDNLINKIKIIPNGVNVELFSINNENVIRQPYRFCFCSSYDRNLIELLKYIWPYIYEAENKAELHIYYGMNYIFNEEFKNHIKFLIGSTNGVMDHGRQDVNTIIREKYMSTFHIYICTSESETDCINVKESLVAGCIPIITDFGVFKERHGLQYNLNNDELNENLYKNIALDIINKMRNSSYIENCRETLKTSNTIITWSNVAEQWLTYI